MSRPTAYTTDDRVTVAAFVAAVQTHREFVIGLEAAAAALGKNKGPLGSTDVFGKRETTALQPDDPDDPPQGWKYSSKLEVLVPRRGKAGDVARQWLADHQPTVSLRTVMDEHGLPYNDLIGSCPDKGGVKRHWSVPDIFHQDGALWALYQGTPSRWIGAGPVWIGPVWKPCLLSRYYTAFEAFQAEQLELEAAAAAATQATGIRS